NMTILGKILVFIILVLALLQAALHIMFHLGQANWVAEFGKLKQSFMVAQAERDAFATERDEARAERDKALGEMQNQLAVLQKQLKDGQDVSLALNNQLGSARDNQTKSDATLAGATTDIQRHVEEVKRLDDAIKDKDKRIGDLVKGNNELRE